MYQALYRKWRSRTFDEIVGQNHITAILKKQAAEDKVSHAYLFCGSRGTGKTSMAKILAKAVNCENPMDGNPCNKCYCCKSVDNATATDVLEIDAASNNRVADVRELIDEVVYPPSVLQKRVYIIDEVHMLSDSAFNALLKTLEEPPEYVLFILATTELNQLPPTIISRCMRFDFKRIEPDTLAELISRVAEKEAIKIQDDAMRLIARLADGSARDALSLLDACSSGGKGESELSVDNIQSQLGITNNDTIISLFNAVANKDIPAALAVIGEVHKSSKDLSVFMTDLISFVRDLLIAKSLGADRDFRREYLHKQFFFSVSASDKLSGLLKAFTIETLLYFCSVLEEALSSVSRYSVNKKTVLELTVIKLCDMSLSEEPKALLARISELEKRLAEGNYASGDKQKPAQKPRIKPLPNPPAEERLADKPPVSKKEAAQKPLTAFPEVLEELKTQPDIYPLVQMTKMLEKDGEVIIIADRFVIEILSQESNKKLLEGAVKAATGKGAIISFKKKDASVDQTDFHLIDEIKI